VQPDRASVVAFLARVHRRLVLKTAIQGATAGSALAIILAIAGWPSRGATALTLAFFGAAVIAGVIAGLALTANRRRRVADARPADVCHALHRRIALHEIDRNRIVPAGRGKRCRHSRGADELLQVRPRDITQVESAEHDAP